MFGFSKKSNFLIFGLYLITTRDQPSHETDLTFFPFIQLKLHISTIFHEKNILFGLILAQKVILKVSN